LIAVSNTLDRLITASLLMHVAFTHSVRLSPRHMHLSCHHQLLLTLHQLHQHSYRRCHQMPLPPYHMHRFQGSQLYHQVLLLKIPRRSRSLLPRRSRSLLPRRSRSLLPRRSRSLLPRRSRSLLPRRSRSLLPRRSRSLKLDLKFFECIYVYDMPCFKLNL